MRFLIIFWVIGFGFCPNLLFAQIPDSLAIKPLFFYQKEQQLQQKHLLILSELQQNTSVPMPQNASVPDLLRKQYEKLQRQSPFQSVTALPPSENLRRLPTWKRPFSQ